MKRAARFLANMLPWVLAAYFMIAAVGRGAPGAPPNSSLNCIKVPPAKVTPPLT